jgi:transposase
MIKSANKSWLNWNFLGWAALIRCYTPTSEEHYGPSRTPHRRNHLERRRTRHAGALGTPTFVVPSAGVAIQDPAGLRGRGATQAEIAAELRCNAVTVGKWRHRFASDRLDGLVDAPRPGAVRTIGDDVIEAVVVETLESAPSDATHWSTRSLGVKHGISHTTVREIWRAFGLKPWRADSFKVSPDPDQVEKIRDLVALYMSPPVAAAVFAVDEKTPDPSAQPHRTDLAMLPTTPARTTHDYERNGA